MGQLGSQYMKKAFLPISKCRSTCSNCLVITDFLMFESGAGGDFETFVGAKTGDIYRLDMHKVHYLNIEEEELLKSCGDREGGVENMRRIPEQVMCKVCKSIFHAVPIIVDGESKISAYDL